MIENAPFNFENQSIRVEHINGEPWFIASDICTALEIGNPSQALKRLDEEDITLISNEGMYNNAVNESGMYALILGSRKPSAKRFKKWVTGEVLPEIRKTGSYNSNQPPASQLPQTYLEALEQLVEKEKKLIEQAPKVALVENLMEREALVNATQVGLPHNLSAQALNKILVEHGGVYNQAIKRGKVFTKEWVNKGYGEVKITPSGHNQSLFTPAGQVRVNEILITEGIV